MPRVRDLCQSRLISHACAGGLDLAGVLAAHGLRLEDPRAETLFSDDFTRTSRSVSALSDRAPRSMWPYSRTMHGVRAGMGPHWQHGSCASVQSIRLLDCWFDMQRCALLKSAFVTG